MCQSSFSSKSNLNKHIKKYHNDNETLPIKKIRSKSVVLDIQGEEDENVSILSSSVVSDNTIQLRIIELENQIKLKDMELKMKDMELKMKDMEIEKLKMNIL